MGENNNTTNENQNIPVNNEESNDEFKQKVEDIVEKIRTQALLLGARTMTLTIANMIDSEMNKPGKRTMADMKRIVKKVREFCQKAIDHPVEAPKFSEEETAQN